MPSSSCCFAASICFGVEEFVVAQRPVDGLVEDHHVGQQREHLGPGFEHAAERVDLLAERGDAGGQRRAIGVRDGDAGRRDGFYVGGEDGAGEEEGEREEAEAGEHGAGIVTEAQSRLTPFVEAVGFEAWSGRAAVKTKPPGSLRNPAVVELLADAN